MAIDRNSIPSSLSQMAELFEHALLTTPAQTGWGQFLDAARRHEQIGLYGTSAGVIVRCLAQRGADATTIQTAQALRTYWTNRDDDYGARRLVQTPRLALLHLAFATLEQTPENAAATNQTRDELLRRQLPSSLWGNYWIDANHNDDTPRAFVSALVLLALAASTPPTAQPAAQPAALLNAANSLEGLLVSTPSLPPHVSVASFASILLARSTAPIRSLTRRMNAIARARPIGLDDQALYFYDYQYRNPANGQIESDRDYVIVPAEALYGIAGFVPNSPIALRLRAESVLSLMQSNIATNRGAFRPTSDERLTTVNQAWCALFLSFALRASEHTSIYNQVMYFLLREREGNALMNFWFPAVTSLIAVALAGVLMELDLPSDWLNVAAKLFTPMGLLVIGDINGEMVIRRLWRRET